MIRILVYLFSIKYTRSNHTDYKKQQTDISRTLSISSKTQALLYFFILTLLLFYQVKSQITLTSQYSIAACTYPYTATFVPTDSTQFVVACSPYSGDSINLYKINSNTFYQSNTYALTTANDVVGIKYFPGQGTYAIVSSYCNYIAIFSISPSSITSVYSLSDTDPLWWVDISPSGNQAAVAAVTALKIYYVTYDQIVFEFEQTFNGGNSCHGVAYYDSSNLLVTCYSAGIQQYYINGFASATWQATYNSANTQGTLTGISFMSNNYALGIFAGPDSDYCSFQFSSSYNTLSASIVSSTSISSPQYAGFSPNNQYAVLTSYNLVTLYTTSTIANCQTPVSNYCTACDPGYYLATSTSCLACANINSYCTSCSQTSTQCLSCSSGYYLANANTCLVCATISQCVACSQTSYACTACASGYYLATSTTCLLCSTIQNCQTCSQSSYACLTCSTGYYLASQTSCLLCSNIINCLTCTQSTNQCLTCAAGNYLAANSLTCIACSSITAQCALCSSASDCSSCNTGYYLASQTSCLPCSDLNAQCNSCSAVAPTCTGCVGTASVAYSRILPNCICPGAYYSNVSVQADCIACYYKCALCSNGTACQTCVNINLSPPACGCLTGQYQIGMTVYCGNCSYACQSCNSSSISNCTTCYGSVGLNSSRILKNCTCPVIGYWDNFPIQNECQACANTRCLTCTNASQICTSCVGNQTAIAARVLPNCMCPNGYYNDPSQINCQACSVNCLTCVTNASNCIVFCSNQCFGCQTNASNCVLCKGNRIAPPVCTCPAETYDDFVSTNCTNCDVTCQTCTLSSGCTMCYGNRISSPSNHMQCVCTNNTVVGIPHSSKTWYCTTCTEAVVTVAFTNNLSGLNVTFDDFISFPNIGTLDTTILSNTLCQILLNSTTLAMMGTACTCGTATAANFSSFSVVFGRNPTITQNNTLGLNPYQILRKDCPSNSTFTSFYANLVQMPTNISNPSVILSGPTSQVSLCVQFTISVSQQFSDGQRGLSNFVWSLKSTTASDTTAISNVILQTNTQYAPSNSLTVPMLTLQPFSQYIFQVTFSNFLGLNGQTFYNINSTFTSGAQVQFQQLPSLSLKVYFQNILDATFYYVHCYNSEFSIAPRSLQVTWTDISQINNTTLLQQYIAGASQISTSQTMPAFTLKPGSTYTYQVRVEDLSNPLLYSFDSITFQASISPLIAYVQGGSRLQAYSEPLLLQGYASDPDQPPATASNNITSQWSCISLSTNLPCSSIAGVAIQYNSSLTQSYGSAIFQPYTVLQFTFTAKSQVTNKQGSQQVVIIIVETELPVLIVSVPPNLFTQRINLNDDISVSVVYDGNADSVYFTVIYIYKFSVVATKTFAYTTFSFKIWDLYNAFTPDTASFLLRISMYDSDYFLPSQNTFNLNINLPPVSGTVTVTPSTGIALYTNFVIQLSSWFDEDTPLSYKYVLYLQNQDYLTEIILGENPTSSLQNTLVDFTPQNQITLFMPQGIYDQSNGGYNILFMVIISDNLGAVSNITTNVTVTPNSINNLDQYLQNVQQIYQNSLALTTEQQIQQLNLLTLDYTLFDANSLASCYQSGTCNSRGLCVQGTNQYCQCQGKYYLRDCSANQSQYMQYLQTKQNIYNSINSLQNLSSTQAIQGQLLKSVNLLLGMNDLGQILTQNEVDSAIAQIASLIEAQTQQLNYLLVEGLLNQGDSKTSRAAQAANSILGKSLGFLDSMIGTISTALNSSNTLRRGLTLTSAYVSFYNIFQLTQSISFAIQSATLPNSDPVIYDGMTFVQSIQVSTMQIVQALLFQQPYQGNNPVQEIKSNSSSLNFSKSFDASVTNNNSSQSSIYKLSQYGFIDNILKYDSSFPYPGQSSQLISINIQRDSSNSTNSLDISESITLNFPLVYSNSNGSAISNAPSVCISRSSDGTWNNNNCQTSLIFTSDQMSNITIIQCLCQSLAPTTVVADVDNLFVESNNRQNLSSGALSTQSNFTFYLSYIFYIFVGLTLFIIMSCIYGFHIDDKRRTKVQPVSESVVLQADKESENRKQKKFKKPQNNNSLQQIQQINSEDPVPQSLTTRNNRLDSKKRLRNGGFRYYYKYLKIIF